MQNLFKMYPDHFPQNSRFQVPPGIVTKEICSKTGKLASDVCRKEGTAIKEIFNVKYVPTEIDRSVPKVQMISEQPVISPKVVEPKVPIQPNPKPGKPSTPPSKEPVKKKGPGHSKEKKKRDQ